MLEAQDDLALTVAGEGHVEQLLLGEVGVARELAGDVDAGAAGDEVEDAGGDELVGQDEVGGLDGLVGGLGEEVRVAGPAACEDDLALLRGERAGARIGATGEAADGAGSLLGGAGVGLEDGLDVVVADAGESAQRPILADLAQPAHPSRLGLVLGALDDEAVEVCALAALLLEVAAGEGRLLLDSSADLTQSGACGAEVCREGGGDLAADARGELAPAAVGGDPYL